MIKLMHSLRRFVDKFDETLDSRFLKLLCENVFYLTPEIALKRASKRRTWTTAERELKSLARKKTPAKKIAKTLKRSGCDAAEGTQYWIAT
jgi:hypothetical protein